MGEAKTSCHEYDRLMEAEDRDLLASAPALVRLAVTAYLRALGWTAGTSVRALRAILSGEAVDALTGEAREQLKRLLGVSDLERRMKALPEPGAERNGDHRAQLKERGAELLARSAAVEEGEEAHPAYERILTSLAPDEARILRLMAIEGARASVDVRTWRPLDVGSELVEPGISMIGQEAGVQSRDRVAAYLNNLHRLGLVWFSREPLDDLSAPTRCSRPSPRSPRRWTGPAAAARSAAPSTSRRSAATSARSACRSTPPASSRSRTSSRTSKR